MTTLISSENLIRRQAALELLSASDETDLEWCLMRFPKLKRLWQVLSQTKGCGCVFRYKIGLVRRRLK